jgi:predicted nucleic acid-binding protein
LLDPGPGHVESVLKLLEGLGTAGNLATDAQIAAAALDQDAIVHTTDMDFMRFQGLRWFNPITGVGSSSQRRVKGA